MEDLPRRDASSKHFKNADGSYTALIGVTPLHYKKAGKWEDIDTKISKTASGEYSYANTANLMESYFGSSAKQGILSKTKEGEVKEFLNTKMYWEVNGKEVGTVYSANSEVSVKGNEAYYNNMYGDISAEFLIETGKRKLNYIIPDKKALGNIPENADYLVFSEDVLLSNGWTHKITKEGVLILDINSNEIYLYENPNSSDVLEELSREKNTIFETEINDNVLTIRTKVKTAWLMDSVRKFPVKVDPTATVYPNNATNWTRCIAEDGYNYGSNLRFGTDNFGFLRIFIKYNTSSIISTAIVNSVTSYFTITNMANPYPGHAFIFYNSADPTTTGGTALYSSPSVPYSLGYLNTTVGQKEVTFNPAGITGVQNGLGSFVTASLNPAGNEYFLNENYTVANHTSASRPYLLIDYTIPACSAPTNLNVGTITSTSARFTWNAANNVPASGYDYYYNTTGVIPTESTTPSGSVGAGVTTVTPTPPLSPNTAYHFWIRSKCTSSNSVWVPGGYFNTNPAQNCFQGDGQIRGTVEDGLNVQTGGVFRVADDFIVPVGEAFTLSHISLEALSASAINGVSINVRANNNGAPGAILNTVWSNTAPTASNLYTTAFGLNVYHLNFTLPTTVTYPAGKYWLEVTMRNSANTAVYWRATTTGSTGATSQNSGNSGASWVANTSGYDMVFYVAGTCTTCTPVTVSASKTLVCANEAITLTANSSDPSYSYHWYLGWDETSQTYQTDLGTGATINPTVTQSTTYWVVATSPTGCRKYTYVTVAVTPAPTLIVMDPVNAITCSNEASQISVVSGGIIPETILNETWDPITNPWIIHTEITGTEIDAARWWLYNDGDMDFDGTEVFHSNDNSAFAMVDSNMSGYFNDEMESSLISPPMSFLDYNSASTNITFTFYHYFRQFTSFPDSDAYVEITTDGVTWTTLRHYNSTVGTRNNFALETINLNAYKGIPYVQIRFRYHAFWEWYWAVDNISITGTNPLPTTVTWSPTTGLWRDAGKTVAYNGAQATTLYASPASTTTYTVSAKTAAGCPSTQTVVVTKGDTDWSGTTTNWNTASNWEGNTVPTADHCVNIPSSTVKPVISVSTEAHAKNLTIQPGGSLDIEGNLTVQDFVKNLGDKRALILSSDANLLQLNTTAANSGEITAHREITIKDNNQYNYLISPLVDSNLKTNIYENKTTGVLSSSQFTLYHNEVNNKFYASSGAYIRGRGLAVKEPSASVVPPGGKIYAHFTGVPMNGDFTYTLANSGTPTTGYNLIGNPYPSNIDIKKLYDDSPGQISENFEFWDNLANAITVQQGSEYKGAAYAIFNAATGTYGVGNPAPGNKDVDPDNPASPGGSKIPNHIVKVGQGFMVRAIGAGVLNFKNTQRTKDQTDSNFYGRNQTVITDDRYWLQLTTPSDMVISNAIVYFDSGNNDFSKDDSKETGTSDALFTYSGTEKVVINGRNKFNIDDVLDIGTRNYTAGINKITLGRKEGIFAASQPIYLKDNQTGAITNLSEGAYTFMAQAGESTGRFEIVYKPGGVLATDAAVKEDVVVYRDGQDFVVKAQRDPVSSVEIFDASGRMVRRVEPNSTVERLDFSAIVNGTYILKIDQKSKITVKKVIK
ncbi:T9SS type A sorting domain-containing protein [Kaistella rhinocerotis]|uniref:T9SS type A sorting domain-containing protein n=1 Tax=Kaistella rhinocerotis TaxID=3026437 RepID=UPI002554F476|nr:T9SS type A sorting domain-containing protein [Kaistella sp. Ran72]